MSPRELTSAFEAYKLHARQAASHSKKGWETFTTAVLKTIFDRLAPTGAEQGAKGVVFLAWGAPAGKLCTGISEVRFHRWQEDVLILTTDA